jgi:vacuolar protein sorting-associated protein VTA1
MSSPSSEDDALAALSPWLLRADEVASHDPRVAYYLRLHAMQEGLRAVAAAGNGAAAAGSKLDGVLRGLMRTLEADKPRAGLAGADADAAHCASFAAKVFDRADKLVRGALKARALGLQRARGCLA